MCAVAKTVPIGGRVSIISLAMTADLLSNMNIPATTKSDLVWKIVELGASLAKKRGIPEYETSEAAIQSLQRRGLDLRTSDRGRRSVARALQDEVMSTDFDAEYMPNRVTKDMLTKTLREEYQAAASVARDLGIEPISFEEFCANKEKLSSPSVDNFNKGDE